MGPQLPGDVTRPVDNRQNAGWKPAARKRAMRRRTFILSGFSFLLLAGGSAAGLVHASVPSNGAFPWTPTSATPTPTISGNEPSPPGGIGNTRSDLEQVYGSASGLRGTMVSFSNGGVAASFTVDRAYSLLVSFGGVPVTDLDVARARIQ